MYDSVGVPRLTGYRKDPNFVRYETPTQKVEEWIALGDLYTAGTGPNGDKEKAGVDAVCGLRSWAHRMSEDAGKMERDQRWGGIFLVSPGLRIRETGQGNSVISNSEKASLRIALGRIAAEKSRLASLSWLP